jgi:hypothetical protein
MTKKPLDLDLNLPDAPDFISTPPRYSVAEMIKLSEPFLPFWNRQRAQLVEKLAPIEEFRFIEDSEIVSERSAKKY